MTSSTLVAEQEFSVRRTQLSASLLEIGALGTAALIVTLIVLWRTAPRLVGEEDPTWQAISQAFPGIVLLYAFMLAYFAAWTATSVTPFIFWLFPSGLLARAHESTALARHGQPARLRAEPNLTSIVDRA